jgi:hypothetical protein
MTSGMIATVDASVLETMVKSGILQSMAAHKTLRWLCDELARRAARQEPDPRTIVVVGGWSALAELSGCDVSEIGQIEAFVMAMGSCAAYDSSGGLFVGLMTWLAIPKRAGRKASLHLRLCEAFVVDGGAAAEEPTT